MPTTVPSIRPALLAAGITHLFYFSGFFVFLTPLPLFYLAIKQDQAAWRLSFLLTVFLALLFYFWLIPAGVEAVYLPRIRFFGLGTLFFYLLCAFFLSLGFWQRWPWVAWGWRSGLGTAGLLLFAGFALQGFGFLDVIGFFHAGVTQAQGILEQMLTQPNVSRELVLQVKGWLAFLPKLLPALLFIFALSVMGLNIWVLKLFRKTAPQLDYFGSFQKLQIPHSSIWVLIAGGLFFFLNEYFFGFEVLQVASWNALLAALFIYFTQGLSILSFYTRHFSPLFRLGIYGLVFLFLHVGGLVLVMVGVVDTWFNFRKL